MVKVATIIVLFLLVAGHVQATIDPSVKVDRTRIAMKESFTLTIEVPGSGITNQPDLSIIKKSFTVVRGAKSTKINVQDGESRAKTQFFYTLTPKRTGKLEIPPFKIGDTTSPTITIHVTEAAIVPSDDGAPDIFLEAVLTDSRPLVQSQVIYTMRLFHAVDIREGSLSEPELRNATVLRLGDDVQYEVDRYNRRYQVVERRFAVFPELSGKMVLPSPLFSGQLAGKRELSSLENAFGQPSNNNANQFGNFFHSTRPIKIEGPEISIDVRPVPQGVDPQKWLPAVAIEIEETWTTRPLTFKVGEPTTRTLTVRARALTAAHLPEVSVPTPDTINVYADRPLIRTFSDGQFVLGERKVKLALVPTESGPFTLPPVVIDWWDTATSTLRRTELPAREITVLPSSTLGSNTADAAPVEGLDVPQTTPYSHQRRSVAWPFAVGALSVIWLITFVAWWRLRAHQTPRHKQAGVKAQSEQFSDRHLRRACLKNDAGVAKDALIQWAARRWKSHPPKTLMAVARYVHSPQTRAAVMELDRALYDASESTWTQGEQLWSCLRSESVEIEISTTDTTPRLPNLYPN